MKIIPHIVHKVKFQTGKRQQEGNQELERTIIRTFIQNLTPKKPPKNRKGRCF